MLLRVPTLLPLCPSWSCSDSFITSADLPLSPLRHHTKPRGLHCYIPAEEKPGRQSPAVKRRHGDLAALMAGSEEVTLVYSFLQLLKDGAVAGPFVHGQNWIPDYMKGSYLDQFVFTLLLKEIPPHQKVLSAVAPQGSVLGFVSFHCSCLFLVIPYTDCPLSLQITLIMSSFFCPSSFFLPVQHFLPPLADCGRFTQPGLYFSMEGDGTRSHCWNIGPNIM